MEERSASQVIDAYPKDGKFFVEVWLIDDSWNQNYWKANRKELDQKIQNFVNKPAILTPYLHHPHDYLHIIEDPFDAPGNVRKHHEIDERYRIGNIVKIKALPNSAYAGIIELTHPGAIEAFRQGKIPRYVSPAVYNLNQTGPMGEFTKFEPLHIAFVDQPAFGLKARIIDTCHNKQDICMRNLGVAAVLGEACIAKALTNLKHTFHSSYVKSNASLGAELSLKEDSATPPTAAAADEPKQATTVSTEQENKESKAAVKQKPEAPSKKEQSNKESTADKDVKQKDAPNKEENKKEEALSVEEIKAIMKEQMAEFMRSYKEEQEARAAKEAKRKLIESYVTLESSNGNKEEWEKRIASLMHIPDDTLQEFLEQHYQIKGKSRSSNAAKASKVSDFNRGMQQNTPQNVGTAALLLVDQDTNDRIDKVLSIVPNTLRARIGA